MTYSSGTSIRTFPSNGFLVKAPKLIDQAAEVLVGDTTTKPNIPVLGFFQPAVEPSAGRIVVYGDSNCFDSAQSEGGLLMLICFFIFSKINFIILMIPIIDLHYNLMFVNLEC